MIHMYTRKNIKDWVSWATVTRQRCVQPREGLVCTLWLVITPSNRNIHVSSRAPVSRIQRVPRALVSGKLEDAQCPCHQEIWLYYRFCLILKCVITKASYPRVIEGIRMYILKASEFQRPIFFIWTSLQPTAAAVVAVPILKPCA